MSFDARPGARDNASISARQPTESTRSSVLGNGAPANSRAAIADRVVRAVK